MEAGWGSGHSGVRVLAFGSMHEAHHLGGWKWTTDGQAGIGVEVIYPGRVVALVVVFVRFPRSELILVARLRALGQIAITRSQR